MFRMVSLRVQLRATALNAFGTKAMEMPSSSGLRVRIAALLCCHLRAACAHNGYTLHITAKNSMAGTKAMVLDAAGNSEVAKLANGWTTSRWIKFEDVSDSQQPSLMLNNHMDSNFYEGFGGLRRYPRAASST